MLIESRLEFLDMNLQLLSESTKYELIGMRMTASNINIFDFTLTVFDEKCDCVTQIQPSQCQISCCSCHPCNLMIVTSFHFFVQSSLFQKVNSQSVLTQVIMKEYFRMVIINIRFYYNF